MNSIERLTALDALEQLHYALLESAFDGSAIPCEDDAGEDGSAFDLPGEDSALAGFMEEAEAACSELASDMERMTEQARFIFAESFEAAQAQMDKFLEAARAELEKASAALAEPGEDEADAR